VLAFAEGAVKKVSASLEMGWHAKEELLKNCCNFSKFLRQCSPERINIYIECMPKTHVLQYSIHGCPVRLTTIILYTLPSVQTKVAITIQILVSFCFPFLSLTKQRHHSILYSQPFVTHSVAGYQTSLNIVADEKSVDPPPV
jgi:hypothetical protein